MNGANIAKAIDGPAGYVLVIAAAGVLFLVIWNKVSSVGSSAISAGNNLDANLGLSGFDAWVSSWFSAPSEQ